VILDESGAEELLGRGDMLFVSKEFKTPRRVQGAFVDTSEVEKVVKYIKSQSGAVMYDEGITEKPRRDLSNLASGPGTASGNYDERVEEAIACVRQARKASSSLLQRRMGLGYARAARILDELEELGVVGPSEGAKPRQVFGPDGAPLSADDENGF
jgi:S-DNA-T family DNA segregation ATPase FtsK/SpoIIIE